MRSKEADKARALIALRKDLANEPSHIFGIHTHCSPDFCTTVQQQQQHQQRRDLTDDLAEGNHADCEQDDSSDSEEVYNGNDSPEGMLQHL